MNKHVELKMEHKSNQGIAGHSVVRLLGILVGLSVCIAIAAGLVFWSQTDSAPFFSTRSDGKDELAVLGAVNPDGTGDKSASHSETIIDTANHTDLGPRKKLENNIARSIMMINNVKSARVLLALPEQPGFGQDTGKASASVVIGIGPELTLTPTQIEAIVHLVAASVPKLEADQVTLTDQRGQLLSNRDDVTVSDEHFRALAYKKHFEEILSGRIVDILSPIVGVDGVHAAVTVDLDFSGERRSQNNSGLELKVSRVTPFPEKPTSVKESATGFITPPGFPTDNSQSALAPAASVLTESVTHLPGYKTRKNAAREQTTDPVSSIKPSLRRLSAAVVIDDKKMTPADGTVQFKPYNQDEMDRFRGLVKQAVGFDDVRGDQVTIINAAFHEADRAPSSPEWPFWRQAWFYPLLKQMTAGLSVLLLFLYIVRPLVRNWLGQGGDIRPLNTHAAQDHDTSSDLHEFSSVHSKELQQIIKDLPNDISEVLLFDTPDNSQLRLEYIKKITDADAHLVAEIIKGWIKNTGIGLNRTDHSALLMLSLGAGRAANVIKHLSPREVQNLGSAMARVEDMSTGTLEKAAEKFITEVKSHSALIVDKNVYIRKMLTTAQGEENAKSLVERILPETLTKGIEQFKWMDSQSVSEIISKEHPQVIAIVLSILDSEQSAEVLMSMPEDLRSDLLVRIATLKGVQPAALRELDQIIEQQLPLNDMGNRTPMGGIDSAAHILNRIDSKTGGLILEQIADQNQELAWNIQEKMFVFDDLIHLDGKEIQTLLREISTSQLLLALKDSGEDFKDKIFKNMSRRAAEMMREDLAMMADTNPSEIEFARKDILNTAKKLADAGELKLKINGD